MFAAVAAVAVLELVVIPLELQRRGHLLISQWPVPVQVVEVSRSILQEDPQRLVLRLANDRGITCPPRMFVKLPTWLSTLRN